MAFTNSLDRRASDEWLVAEIARRINQGLLNPADLYSGLRPLGFSASPPAPLGLILGNIRQRCS